MAAALEDEVAEIDTGLAPGNYFNYTDKDIALQAEIDLLDGVAGYFCDTTFPADTRSLYFDPLHPPKGSLPGISIKWNRICAGEVMDCTKPVFCSGRPSSPMIVQGCIGNAHFINSLRLLACRPEQLTTLLVSDKNASQGLYTFKFYKAGQWRYVHIDDRIPCRHSGKVNFARNEDPNETFIMLLEKAYAKLHGCYEALVHGILERTIMELTPAADCRCRRNELNQDLDTIVDNTWDILEDGLKRKRLIGCGKWVPDPYCERLADRQGITVGHMYQVLSVDTVTAFPTEDLDALTIGVVCVRNLQKGEGFFNGKWSIGHQNWTMYREIGIKLRHRTREIMFERGLGLDPNERNDDDQLVNFIKDDEFFDDENRSGIEAFLKLEQPDEPDAMTAAFLGRANLLSPQPYEKDLHWIAIDDFVDIFNRIYVLTDLTLGQERPLETKKFFSKWMPGDFLCGSGGPPLLLEENFDADEENRIKREKLQQKKDADLTQTLSLMEASYQEHDDRDDNSLAMEVARNLELKEDIGQFTKDTSKDNSSSEGGNGFDGTRNDGNAKRKAKSNALEGNEIANVAIMNAKKTPTEAATESKKADLDQDITDGAGFAVFEPDDSDEERDGANKAATEDGKKNDGEVVSPFGPYKSIDMNEDFTDNPMYPFSVNEPTTVCFALYQSDRRWSVGRLGDEPREILSSEFARRGQRLASCMKYANSGIGFVIVRLFGLKHRCTEFKLRKVVACSDSLAFSNVCSCSASFLPGRYAIIPYTNKKVLEPQNYILHAHFTSRNVEFEVDDVIEQRLKDDILSDDESAAEEDELEEEDPNLTPEELDALEAQREIGKMKKKFNLLPNKPPLPWAPQPWEYLENTEDLGVVSVFDEVGDLARYMNNLNVEINKLKHTIETLELHYNGAVGGATSTSPDPRAGSPGGEKRTIGSKQSSSSATPGQKSPSKK